MSAAVDDCDYYADVEAETTTTEIEPSILLPEDEPRDHKRHLAHLTRIRPPGRGRENRPCAASVLHGSVMEELGTGDKGFERKQAREKRFRAKKEASVKGMGLVRADGRWQRGDGAVGLDWGV